MTELVISPERICDWLKLSLANAMPVIALADSQASERNRSLPGYLNWKN